MLRVAIVDDEPVIRFGIRASVDWERENIGLAGDYPNGEEAWREISREPVDILITDIKMPVMDGLELTRRTLAQYPRTKVILVSSYNEFDYVKQGLQLGVLDYLLKPTLEPEGLLELIRKCVRLIEDERSNERNRQIVQSMLQAQAANGEAASLSASFAVGAAEQLASSAGSDAIPETGTGNKQLIARSVAYIQANFTSDLTLRQVADYVHMSKNYFCAQFKRYVGENYMDYVIRLRIDRAKQLLAHPDSGFKIYEVAERAGFNDVKYFSKLFKKMTGLSPVEYRERAGGERLE